MIAICIVKAHGLRNADVGGKSDPFLFVKHRGKKYKGKVVEDNLNPVFMETIHIPFRRGKDDSKVRVEIFDKDDFGANDSLGYIDLDVSAMGPGQSKATRQLEGKGALKGSTVSLTVDKRAAAWDSRETKWVRDPAANKLNARKRRGSNSSS
eukprot:Selendium_serpulae@DN5790_c2_g1_i4.p3